MTRVTRALRGFPPILAPLRRRLAHFRGRLGEFIFLVLAAIVGASLTLTLLGRLSCNVAGLDLTIKVGVGRPGTSLELPPLGAATATTHLSPLNISMRLDSVDPGIVARLAGGGAGGINAFSTLLEEEARRMLPRLILLILSLGALGGAFFVYTFVRPARPGRILGGLFVGLVYSLFLVTGAYLTFDTESFKSARYSGVMEAAPWILGVLDKSVSRVGELNTTINTIASNASIVFRQIESLQPVPAEGRLVRVLHVSDLHDNTQAVKFIAQLVKSFDVNFVVDSGDITDYGMEAELELTKEIARLPVPYIFVGGNHDSPGVLEAMRRYPNVRLAGGSLVKVDGITVLGLDDPGAARAIMEASTDNEIHEEVTRGLEILDGLGRTPDVLVTHDPREAEAFCGRVPVVLHGHDHRLRVRTMNDSVIIDAGSTGGAGIRGLVATEEVPMTVALLHFEIPGDPGMAGARLVAVDTITLAQLKGGFTLERRFVGSAGKGR
ncbi:MAG TPA: hypothetical protein GX506_08635 [Firmicutes bacterium]|nr:hypothetical protein [Bacillota bacterium]